MLASIQMYLKQFFHQLLSCKL